MAGGSFGGGTGTPTDPYLIEDAADLNAVRTKLTSSYKVVSDIDLNIAPYNVDPGWVPIGGNFTGVFDGNNKVIRNLYSKRATGYSGLFYTIFTNAIVKNVILENVNIIMSSGNYAGALAAYVSSSPTIENCHSSGIITIVGQTSYVGGLIGQAINSSKIEKCSSSVKITKTGAVRTDQVGGLAGRTERSTINECYATGDIDVQVSNNSYNTGGLMGDIIGCTINGCYATGAVKSHYNTGGFAGKIMPYTTAPVVKTFIRECYAIGTVTATGANSGGFAGMIDADTPTDLYIGFSYALGDITTTNYYAGGFVGDFQGVIESCFAKGSITAPNYAGGFAGLGNDNSTSLKAKISNSYSTGFINSAGSSCGGFLGYDNSNRVIIVDCYWDINSSGKTTTYGSKGIGKTTAEMKIGAPNSTTYTEFENSVTPDGEIAWLFAEGSYPVLFYMAQVKFLFQDGTDIKKWNPALVPPAWELVGTVPVIKSMFDTDGMEDLFLIDRSAIDDLISDSPELLMLTSGAKKKQSLIPKLSADSEVISGIEYEATASGNDTNSKSFRAFDKNSATSWVGSVPKTGWLKINLGQKVRVDEYKISAGLHGAPKDFRLEASNTGEFAGEEVILDSQVGQLYSSNTVDIITKTYVIAAPGEYQYYRLNIITNRTDITKPEIMELMFFKGNSSQEAGSYPAAITKVPHGKLVLPISDLVINGEMDSVNLSVPTLTGGADIKVILSIDSGATWKSWNGTQWIAIETSVKSNVKSYGMTPSAINALTKSQWNLLGITDKIRFAFYLEKDSSTDVSQIDRLIINEKIYTSTPAINSIDVIYELLKGESPAIFVSRDNGVTWKEIEKDTLSGLSDLPEGQQLRVKAVLQNGQELHALSYSWI